MGALARPLKLLVALLHGNEKVVCMNCEIHGGVYFVSKLIVIFDQFVEVTLDSVDIFSTVLIKRFLYVIPAVEYLVHDCLSIV